MKNAHDSKETTVRKTLPRGPMLKINVTKEIISHSKQRDSSHCMTAEAVRQAIPIATSVAVDLQTIRFSLPDRDIRCTYLTPRIAQVAIIDFDQGKTPEPFSFRLGGAQVIPMHHKKPGRVAPRPLSDAQKAGLQKAQAMLRPITNDHGEVPDKIGGRPPPTTPFARKRAFGLRALVR